MSESRRSRAAAALVLLVMLGAALAVLLGVRGYAVGSTSMTPTLPVGSLAVVVKVDSDDVRVGDVVRVRGSLGGEPRRVVEVSAAGGGLTALTVRGDGEATDRPPEVVPSVDRILFAVPFAGHLVAVLTSGPGLVVLGASVLVLAARRDAQSGQSRVGAQAGAPAAPPRETSLTDQGRPRSSSRAW